MSGDTEVKTQKWTPQAMKAARIIGERFESGPIWAETVAEIISLATKDAEMADLLRRAHLELGSEHGTVARPHCSCPLCSEIKALLTTLEKI